MSKKEYLMTSMVIFSTLLLSSGFAGFLIAKEDYPNGIIFASLTSILTLFFADAISKAFKYDHE